jgi:membrane-bound ClpP family serine protease
MNKRLTRIRFVLAVLSTGLEEVAVWAIWIHVLPNYGIDLPAALLITVMVVWAAFCAWLFIFTTRTLNKQSQAGLSSMMGTSGEAVKDLDPEGQVKIRGELWTAVADEGKIQAGEKITVVRQNGLKLWVSKIDSGKTKR